MSESHEQEQSNEWPRINPRVWIASLADYVDGRLHGEWVDAAVEASVLQEAAQRILATSSQPNAEEWAIFDYDNFGAYQPGEYEDLATVATIARGIEEHGFAFAAWAEESDANIVDLNTEFEDAFIGFYDSREQFVDSIIDDFGIQLTIEREIPAWLQPHVTIDREGVVRDMEISGDVIITDAPGGGVYVFHN